MRTSPDHLPEAKRRELAYALELVRDGFAEALSRRTQARFREGRILKVVLFGSYARGGWVEDPIGRYYSDFDLLVVVNHEDLTDPSEFWGATERRLLAALSEGVSLRTPVSLIVHSLEDVNHQLRLGRPFFVDIVRDGVLLLDDPGAAFVQPDALEPTTALSEAGMYREEWLSSANQFLVNARENTERGWSKSAAFLLHQSVERYYHAVLLVAALYSPKTHSLNRLRTLCEELDRRLIAVWPAKTKFERRCYQLLRSAYVKARYSTHYSITAEELAWLLTRVGLLQELVEEICDERIEELSKRVVSG